MQETQAKPQVLRASVRSTRRRRSLRSLHEASGHSDSRSCSPQRPGMQGQCLPRVAPPRSRPSRGVEMAASFFSKGFLEQIRRHAQVRIHPLQSTVLLLDGLHLTDHRRIHPAILRPPFLERHVVHAMLAAQLGHRHAAFGLPQDREGLRLGVSACLHSKSSRFSCRENSTDAAPYFRGNYPCKAALSGQDRGQTIRKSDADSVA